MAAIPVPNGISVEMIYTHSSQRVENVYWLRPVVIPSTPDLVAIATAFRDWEQATARLQRVNAVSLVLIVAADRSAVGMPIYELPVSPVITGSIAPGTYMSPMVTLAVRHGTGLAGRSFRGRTYHIGLHTTLANADGTLPLATAASVAGIYNTLRANLLTAGYVLCVCSMYSGVQVVNGYRRPIERDAGILTPILLSSAENTLDTNRHRKLPQSV